MTMATQTEGMPVRVQGTYGYYRQPDGWITVSPATDSDELRYRRSGWEPMRQYGKFEMATPYMASHPFEPLFMKGGAFEFTEDQIRKQGLYLDPPSIPSCKMPLSQEHRRHTAICLSNAKPVVFPQLAGMTDLGPFSCRFGCGRELPTVEARDQHEGVMHGPEKSNDRTGQSLAAALLQGFSGTGVGAPSPALAQRVAEAVEGVPFTDAQLAVLKTVGVTGPSDQVVDDLRAQLAEMRAQMSALLEASVAAAQPAQPSALSQSAKASWQRRKTAAAARNAK